jgi:hypothetical protein
LSRSIQERIDMPRIEFRLRFSFSALVLAAALLLTLFAPARAAADDDDPPSRVARISSLRGSVSFNPAGTEDWVDAVLNRPVTTGDKLWADNNARAELHLGSASIRMSSNSGFSFLNLDDNTTQLQLTEGTLRIRVKRLESGETFEVDTPNLAFSLLRPGIYKINVNQSGDATIVEVRDGQGEVTGGGSAYNIRAGESGTFSGTDQLSADVESYGGDNDEFDSWCNDRDRREDHAPSARYVSDDVVGYEDLDDYGGWRDVPDYGHVWFPHVTVVGWEPYRYGHWVWISPWGWTWVEDEPWGFAPFHYGRWVVVSGVWGWVPAPPRPVAVAYVRPVYSPALVAWVGGPHFAVGIGVGGGAPVGWFPLGPREVYVPTYHVSRNYVTNVNVSNTVVNTTVVNNYYNNVVVNKQVNVTNVNYVNRQHVTVVNSSTFTSAQPVARNMVRVDSRQVTTAAVVSTGPAFAPERRSVLGAGGEARVRPPAPVVNRSVVARTAPPPPVANFAQQRERIEANGGRPVPVSQIRQAGPHTASAEGPGQPPQQAQGRPNVRIAPAARPVTVQPGYNRPAPAQNMPSTNGRPPINQVPPAYQQQNANRPPSVPQQEAPANANRPPNPANPNNPPTERNDRRFNDRPPAARQGGAQNAANPELDRRHQQQIDQLRQKQDQERQRVEQQQVRQQQQMEKQHANEQRQQETQQRQQQQLQQVERKHEEQQQKLEQKQQQERARQENRPPRQESKPSKPEKPPKQDHPNH